MSRTKRSVRPRAAHFFLLSFFFFLFSSSAEAISFGPLNQADSEYLRELHAKARELKLHEDRYWRLLLHYQDGWFGGSESEADGLGFFLSVEGKENPAKELQAALGAFMAPGFPNPERQHPQCRFPERFRWLGEKLGFDPERMPQRKCQRFQEWKQALDSESMTLIFASYYVNNPATMFGHTLLRFDRKGERKGFDLLDYAVNYAANTGEDRGFFYAILGLVGGYPGTFSTYPYYYKVQQYNNVDRRDIWEYKLSFNEAQVGRVLNHLWELGATFFRYYFIDENCSYHLLSLLEVADPSLKLRDDLHFFVAPSDTVKAAWRREGVVESLGYRPSKLSRFQQRIRLLDNQEEYLLKRLTHENADIEEVFPKDMEEDRKALVLDTLIEYLSIRHKRPNVNEYQKKVLLERSELDVRMDVENKPLSSPPHLGHDSARVGFGGGYGSDESFGELRFRGAFHDLMAHDAGYPANASVEALRTSLRFNETGRKVHLEELTAINIFSLYPVSTFFQKPSWTVSFGWETLRNDDCGRCGALFLRGGPGLSFQSQLGRREVYYVFANAHAQVSPWSSTDYRIGPLGRGGILVDFASWWKLGVEAYHDYSPLGAPKFDYGGKVEQRWSLSKDWEIRVDARKFKRGHEAGLYVHHYY